MDKLDIKLQAIKDKNLDEIIAKGTYIPSLGFDYTKKQLADWLQVRIDYLENAKSKDIATLTSDKDSDYAKIKAKDKTKANEILAGDDTLLDDSNPEEYEALIKLVLYRFVIEAKGS